jgi:hypothetical protein
LNIDNTDVQGWFAVRRDHHLLMFIFLFLSVLYLAGWGFMFFSTTFRWTFMTWTFFSVMASTSVFITCMALILGVICRLNFGKGLVKYRKLVIIKFPYLYRSLPVPTVGTEPSSPADDQQFDRKGDDEKVAFSISEKALPTFVSFEKHAGGKLDRLLHTNFGSAEVKAHIVTFPKSAMKRNSKDVDVRRNNSSVSSTNDSQGYYHSRSESNYSSHSSRSHKERWVIE